MRASAEAGEGSAFVQSAAADRPVSEGVPIMNQIIWIVGAVVIVIAILSFFGLR